MLIDFLIGVASPKLKVPSMFKVGISFSEAPDVASFVQIAVQEPLCLSGWSRGGKGCHSFLPLFCQVFWPESYLWVPWGKADTAGTSCGSAQCGEKNAHFSSLPLVQSTLNGAILGSGRCGQTEQGASGGNKGAVTWPHPQSTLSQLLLCLWPSADGWEGHLRFKCQFPYL